MEDVGNGGLDEGAKVISLFRGGDGGDVDGRSVAENAGGDLPQAQGSRFFEFLCDKMEDRRVLLLVGQGDKIDKSRLLCYFVDSFGEMLGGIDGRFKGMFLDELRRVVLASSEWVMYIGSLESIFGLYKHIAYYDFMVERGNEVYSGDLVQGIDRLKRAQALYRTVFVALVSVTVKAYRDLINGQHVRLLQRRFGHRGKGILRVVE